MLKAVRLLTCAFAVAACTSEVAAPTSDQAEYAEWLALRTGSQEIIWQPPGQEYVVVWTAADSALIDSDVTRAWRHDGEYVFGLSALGPAAVNTNVHSNDGSLVCAAEGEIVSLRVSDEGLIAVVVEPGGTSLVGCDDGDQLGGSSIEQPFPWTGDNETALGVVRKELAGGSTTVGIVDANTGRVLDEFDAVGLLHFP